MDDSGEDKTITVGEPGATGGHTSAHDQDDPETAVRASEAKADKIVVGDPQNQQRANLAYALTLLLAVVILTQFTFIFVLEWNTKKSTDSLEKAFNVTLPVISGLVSSAVTFYFAKKT
jgi:hypothetical protein